MFIQILMQYVQTFLDPKEAETWQQDRELGLLFVTFPETLGPVNKSA